MSRSRSLALGAAVGVLSVGGVAASQAATTPKSTTAPPASAGAQVDRAVQERLGASLAERAAKAGKPKKPDRSAAKLAPTADKHRGRVSAARALELTRQGAPDLALSSALIPKASSVEEIISDRVVQVTDAGGSDLTHGLLGKENEKATRLVLSNLPMATLKDPEAKGDAKFELADIDWQAAAGERFTLTRPVSQVSLPKAAGGLARLQNGLGVRLAGANSTAEGHATGETVTYPNVGTDTDMVVRSLPTGFGVGWTLRSPSATHEIKVPMDLPSGQSLRREPTGAVSVVDQGGDVTSEVTPATAIDADHQSVGLSTKVEDDSIVYDVDHAEGKVAYPVTVDPYVYATTWNNGSSTSIDGWRAQNTPQPSAPYQYVTPSGQQGSILGIYGPAGYYAQNESAAWARYPPGNPAAPKGPGSGHARWTTFVAGSVGYGYAPTTGVHYYNYASGQIFIADSAGNIKNTVGALPSGTSGQTFTLNASGDGLAIDNQIGFGLTLPPFYYQYDHPAAAINMGYFQATADDPTPPTESVSGNAGWLDENGSVTASAADNGFGPQLIGIQNPDATPIGSYVGRDCPTAQVTAAMICPYTWSQNLPVAAAPEGISTQYVVAADANNTASRAPFTLKLDKTAPDLTVSGPFYDQKDQDINPASLAKLHFDTADGDSNKAGSGVKSVRILVDGSQAAQFDQQQPGDNAQLHNDWTPPASAFAGGSQFIITVVATDTVGHEKTFSFTMHTTPPDAQATEDPSVQVDAATDYMTANNVDMNQAMSNLTMQDKANGLDDLLNRDFNDSYVGMWPSQNGQRISVNTSDPSRDGVVNADIAAAGLSGSVDIQHSSNSWAQLTSAQSSLISSLQAQFDAQKLTVSIDPATGLVLRKRSDLSASDEAQIAQQIAASPVPVQTVLDQGDLGLTPTACSTSSGDCDPPLRGGVRIVSENSQACSVGFVARSRSDSKLYVLTAGHCLAPTQGKAWAAIGPNTGGGIIGTAGDKFRDSPTGDFGIIPISGSSIWNTVAPFVTKWGTPSQQYDPNYTIRHSPRFTPTPTAYRKDKRKGFWICDSGVARGTTPRTVCGQVFETAVRTAHGPVALFSTCAANKDSIIPGMSGGPVFKNHTPYGLGNYFTDFTSSQGKHCHGVYNSAKGAEDTLNVDILTRR